MCVSHGTADEKWAVVEETGYDVVLINWGNSARPLFWFLSTLAIRAFLPLDVGRVPLEGRSGGPL